MKALYSIINYYLIWGVKLFFPKYWGVSTKVVHAQAELETGKFTSGVYHENNNLFGMRHPSKRRTTSLGSGRGEDAQGQAMYSSRIDSIRDYFLRQEYFKISSENDDKFMNATIASGYAADKDYLKKWKSVYTGWNFNAKILLVPVFLILISIGYVVYRITKK